MERATTSSTPARLAMARVSAPAAVDSKQHVVSFGSLLRNAPPALTIKRDENTPANNTTTTNSASDTTLLLLSDMDLSTVSPLCHQLLETKKRMLSELSPAAVDSGATDARSDDDEPATATSSPFALRTDKPPYKQSKLKTAAGSSAVGDALTPEQILQRKAQRRREQVRAASRRCRDRQRRETEELRKKVFQLEEFIAHTIKSYEWELRQQQVQIDALARANEQLAAVQSGVARSPAGQRLVPVTDRRLLSSVSPAGVDSPVFDVIKAEEVAPFAQPATPPSAAPGRVLTVSDQWRAYDDLEHLSVKVDETKAILSKILVPPAHPEITQKAFGWTFQFWLEGARYYAKSSKFFPGVRGLDIAHRMHRIEPAKYIETFPEVYAKKVLKVFHDHLKIVETVKALPGKQPLGSVTVQFVSHDDAYAGNRCFFANRSVALPQSTSFGHHEECNGYAFEDMTRTASDGSIVDGCLVQGVGGYDSMGKQPEVLMAELAKVFSSVVLRWESLFVNDYIPDDVEASLEDFELDFET